MMFTYFVCVSIICGDWLIDWQMCNFFYKTQFYGVWIDFSELWEHNLVLFIEPSFDLASEHGFWDCLLTACIAQNLKSHCIV